ncbi:MAG: response regulator, partial [Chloroflexi bacterium]|nr:response regulator [Chloroflexota bacterium]
MTDRSPLVLVVDDEPDTLGLVTLTLETAGYSVKAAASGGEALLLA